MSISIYINEPVGGLTNRTAYGYNVDGQQSFQLQRGSRGKAAITFFIAAADTYSPTSGSPIYIHEIQGLTDTIVFAGMINAVDYEWKTVSGDRFAFLDCVSFEQVFDGIQVFPVKVYIGKTCGFIVADLLSTVCSGVPVSAGTISDGPIINIYPIDHPRVSDVFDDLATRAGFIWYVSQATSTLQFGLASTVAAPITLGNSDVLFDTIRYNNSHNNYRNRQGVRIPFSSFSPSVGFFAGDASTKGFTLDYPQTGDAPVVSDVTGVRASATVNFTGQPSANSTVKLGGFAYVFRASIDNSTRFGGSAIKATAYLSLIGASSGHAIVNYFSTMRIGQRTFSFNGSTSTNGVVIITGANDGQTMDHIADYYAGVNSGVTWFAGPTTIADTVSAAYDSINHALTISALSPGTAGNSITASTSGVGIQMLTAVAGSVTAYLVGGSDAATATDISIQVLIGANSTATCLNLFDAINANPSTAGTTFSLWAWENSLCNAITNSGTSFTLTAKLHGTAGNSIATSGVTNVTVGSMASGTAGTTVALTVGASSNFQAAVAASAAGVIVGPVGSANIHNGDAFSYFIGFTVLFSTALPASGGGNSPLYIKLQASDGLTFDSIQDYLNNVNRGVTWQLGGGTEVLPTIAYDTTNHAIIYTYPTSGAAGNSINVTDNTGAARIKWLTAVGGSPTGQLAGGIDAGVIAPTGGTAQVYYGPNTPYLMCVTAPAVGHSLEAQYRRLGSDCIKVEDTAQVASLATIEHGTGKYQMIYSDSGENDPNSGFQAAQQVLLAYGNMVTAWTFQTDTPFLLPGQLLSVALNSPTNAAGTLNGSWIVQSISATYLAGMQHFRYTVGLVSAQVLDYVRFWRKVLG